jgi:cholesterol transport system auxiliary component
MNSPLLRAALLGAALIFVSGCMLARQSAPIAILAPQVVIEAEPDWRTVHWSLTIERPRSDALRDSSRVLVRVPPSQLEVFPGAGWLEPAPDLVQSVLLRGFEDSGRIAAVGRDGTLRSRFRLNSELRHFEAVDQAGNLSVEVELQVRLILARTGQVLASGNFRHSAPAGGRSLDELTAAFETALEQVAVHVIGWTLQAGEEAPSRSEPGREGRRGANREPES